MPSQKPTLSKKMKQYCTICGDSATGKHYGAFSCDGCKGFFRRSVRKNHMYKCRFSRNCVVTKHHRNRCRFCRFRKCLSAGMKKDAVQNERDKIKYQHSRRKRQQMRGISVPILIEADKIIRAICGPEMQNEDVNRSAMGRATIYDVCRAHQMHLVKLVEWCKNIPSFNHLILDDQAELIRARVTEQLLLDSFNSSDTYNNLFKMSDDGQEELEEFDDQLTPGIVSRVINELYAPLKELQVDEVELACLRAILLFDPNAQGLYNSKKVDLLRKCILIMLEEYLIAKEGGPSGRMGEILLVIPCLQSIGGQIVQEIILSKTLRGMQYDDILQDIFIGDVDDFPLSGEALSKQEFEAR